MMDDIGRSPSGPGHSALQPKPASRLGHSASVPNAAELAARCEAAEGPDRELDALIHCVHEGLEFVLIGTGKEAYGSICDPSDSGFGSPNTTTPGLLYARYPDHKNPPTLGGGKRGNIVQGCTARHYTASLDAAMQLAEGFLLVALSDIAADGLTACCLCSDTASNPPAEHWGIPRATGPRQEVMARAVCAAALRARAAGDAQ